MGVKGEEETSKIMICCHCSAISVQKEVFNW